MSKSRFELITAASEKNGPIYNIGVPTKTDMINCESCMLFKQCTKKPIKKNDPSTLETANCANLLQITIHQSSFQSDKIKRETSYGVSKTK